MTALDTPLSEAMTVGNMTVEELVELITSVLDKHAERKVLVGYKDVEKMTGLSAPTIRKMVNAGTFPKPITGTGARGSDVRFLRSDIEKLGRV